MKGFSVLLLLLLTIFQHKTSGEATQASFRDFTAAVSKFSSELYQQSIDISPGNVVISPYSALDAIILLSQTTDGNTIYLFRKKFNLTGTDADLVNNYVEYQKSLTKSAHNSAFVVANKLLVQNLYAVHEKFQDIVQTDVELIDLTNQVKTAQQLNVFIGGKTQNRTGDIIEPTLFTENSRIVLMNTIYMNVNFERIFQRFTIEKSRFETFDVSNQEISVRYVDVEYMRFYCGDFKFAALDELDATAVEIRFDNSEFALILILPDIKKDLFELETVMNNFDFTKIIDRMRPKRIYAHIPIFQVVHQMSLKNISRDMEVLDRNLFDMYNANLTKLLKNKEYVSVDDAILTSVIELSPGNKMDERMNDLLFKLSHLYSNENETTWFVANRPFLYYIWDGKTNTAIFSGRLKEFEGIHRKITFPPGSKPICFDVDGSEISCVDISQNIFEKID